MNRKILPQLTLFIMATKFQTKTVITGLVCQISARSMCQTTKCCQSPVIRKDLRDISYTSRVIADFVPKFVAMATGVGHGRIYLALFNSPTPKTPCYKQRSRRYLLHKPSYSQFCPKFRSHGNRGHPEVNLNDAVK